MNRDGEICAYTTSTADPSQVWPGSQAIAKSKAYTANAFSLGKLALSTARLNLAGLNPSGGALADDITYSSVDGASVFTHPLCPNTFRNGVFIGNESPAAAY